MSLCSAALLQAAVQGLTFSVPYVSIIAAVPSIALLALFLCSMHAVLKGLSCTLQDNSRAARMLAEHGKVTAAITHLMRSLHRAAALGQPVNPGWADKATLAQLYTYCVSLDSQWALQQVSIH